MKSLLALVLALQSTCQLLAADAAAPAKLAVLKQDVSVPGLSADALPLVERGQELPAIRATDDGYQVICRVSCDLSGVGLLPYRDQWGRLTASPWTQDGTLEDHMIRVTEPVPLVTTSLKLACGEKYPLVRSEGSKHIILFQSGGHSVALPVPTNAVVLEDVPRPPPSPADPRKFQLAQTLAQRQATREELQEKDRRATEDNAAILDLLKQLNQADAECKVLQAQVAKHEEIRQQLMRYTPETAKAQEQRAQEIDKLIRQQGAPETKLATKQLEKETLEAARKQIASSDEELERLKAEAAKLTAELDTLAAHFSDPAVAADKEALRAILQKEAGGVTAGAVAVGKSERERDLCTIFDKQITGLRAENARLQAALDTLTKEIEQLRKNITAPAAATPAAAVEPAAPPVRVAPVAPVAPVVPAKN